MKNSNEMTLQINSISKDLEKYTYGLEHNMKQIQIIQNEFDTHLYVTDYAIKAKSSSDEALTQSEVSNKHATDMLHKIKKDLRKNANDLNSFSSAELENIPRKISESQRVLQSVE